MKKILATLIVVMFIFTSTAWSGTYLVKWKGQAKAGKVYKNILGGSLSKIELSEQQADLMAESEDIEYVEEDGVVDIALTPNDTMYGELWAMPMISMPEAWDITTGLADVVVAVIDTGIDYTHPDLVANVFTDPLDGSHGWNAITGVADPMDDHGHGTHVSGTIGGVGNNTIGVAGVNWDVTIVGCKFLNQYGSGWTSDAVECLNYIQGLKDRGINIKISSNSWGGTGYNQSLHDAICSMDALFVAAAGNAGWDTDVTPFYPSAYDCPNILSVAATDITDNKASFSNYGLVTVDMGAPGVNILSFHLNGGYAYMSGTSMATPHVAGTAGLLLSDYPYTVSELKSRLMDYGDDNPSLAGKTVSGKRLNTHGSLVGDTPPPPENEPPSADFSYSTFKKQIRFSNLSSDIDGYIVSYYWEFGDGKTGGARNPKHVYHASGDYVVTLTVTDDDGATATVSKLVSVTINKK